MADQEKDKQVQIDDMLDSLLANYSSAEPRPGLETRILVNLREATGRESSPGWWTFKWLWAGAAVAVAIIVAVVLIGGRQRVISPANVVVKNSVLMEHPAVQNSGTNSGDPAVRAYHRKLSLPHSLPKSETLALNRLAVFPTPTPLSEQERLMFTYLANTPHEVVVAEIQRNDQKEEEAFWKDRDESSAAGRSTTNR